MRKSFYIISRTKQLDLLPLVYCVSVPARSRPSERAEIGIQSEPTKQECAGGGADDTPKIRTGNQEDSS